MEDEIRYCAPAFPAPGLRDYFAGKAMAAIPHIGCGADLDTKEFAEACYQLADEMIKARETK